MEEQTVAEVGVSKPRVLFVDDEPNLLSGLTRQLHAQFDVTTAVGGAEGLKTFAEKGPFPVVVSDLQMPGMDGVTFLGRVRHVCPDTVRILLTGQADLNSAISAVNEGHIFRFLTKPCPTDVLSKSLIAAEAQYKLIISEKILLEQTLQGSIKTLMDILSLASPAVFSRANRIKLYAKDLLAQIEMKNKWTVDVSVMLSQIGIITLPDETLNKLVKNEELKPEEKVMVEKLPSIGEKLLSHIPRLEPVREILLYQEKHFDGSGYPKDDKKGDQIPLGSRILKILLDYEKLEETQKTNIFEVMTGRRGWYDEDILKKFAELRGNTQSNAKVKEVPVSGLQVGMLLIQDIVAKNGVLIVRGGVELTDPVLARIANIAQQIGVKEPIRVDVSHDEKAGTA